MNKTVALIALSFFLSISSMMNGPAIMATTPDTKIILSIIYIASIVYMVVFVAVALMNWIYNKYNQVKNSKGEPNKAIHALMLLSEQYQNEKSPVVAKTILSLVENEVPNMNHEEPKPKCCNSIRKIFLKHPDDKLRTDPFMVYRQIRDEHDKQRIWETYLEPKKEKNEL